MKIAICYRGHYFRTKSKGSNFFLCYDNHKKMLLDYYPNSDIYFHSHSVDSSTDFKLINLLKPQKHSFEKTKYISDSFIEANNQIDLNKNYDLVLNLRFDLLFQKSILDFSIEHDKFNFTWEERKHYRTSLGYRKVTDLMFAMSPEYINHFNDACVDSRYSGGIRGTGHHLYPFLCESIGKENINFMVDVHYDSHTDGKNNKHLVINRSR
jgi:hypothetical protein